MNEILQKAMEFAAVKHAGQIRKGTANFPYFTHVMETMEIVCRITKDENLRAAAVLHDTLEDTDTTKEELTHVFGEEITKLVAAESEDKRKGKPEKATWRERKEETVRHLENAGTDIKTIALGDKLSNVRAMWRDYQVIEEELWQRFNNPNPKDHGWYYCSIANAIHKDETLRTTPAFKEYTGLCTELFGIGCDADGRMKTES